MNSDNMDFLAGPPPADEGPNYEWGEPKLPVTPQTPAAPGLVATPVTKRKIAKRSFVMLIVAVAVAVVFAVVGGIGAFAMTRDSTSLIGDAPLGGLVHFVGDQTNDSLELDIDYSAGDDMSSQESEEFLRRYDRDQKDLKALLKHFGFSDAVHSRMGRTRALDGTEDAESDKVKAFWTYHPDDGLSIVFEKKK